MNEREARDAVRPLGNVHPLPRMQEQDGEAAKLSDDQLDELPYPEGPLASRRVATEEEYAELARATRGRSSISGVRLWMTWPGDPDIAEQVAEGLAEVAKTFGFDVLDVTAEKMR